MFVCICCYPRVSAFPFLKQKYQFLSVLVLFSACSRFVRFCVLSVVLCMGCIRLARCSAVAFRCGVRAFAFVFVPVLCFLLVCLSSPVSYVRSLGNDDEHLFVKLLLMMMMICSL